MPKWLLFETTAPKCFVDFGGSKLSRYARADKFTNKQYSSISFPAPNNMQLSWVVSAVISSKDRVGKATKSPHAVHAMRGNIGRNQTIGKKRPCHRV